MAAPAGSTWAGSLAGCRTDPPADSLTLDAPLEVGTGGGSGSFWGLASDGQRWRVKPLNGAHGEMASVNEYLVGRVGQVIGAPVCEVSLIWVPPDVAGWEFQPGRNLTVGVAVASKEVPGCHEERALTHRQQDDNHKRHAGVYALYDWCFGADDQWLYETPADDAVHSHDHGMYLPGGPDWRLHDLTSYVRDPHPLATPAHGVDPPSLEICAIRLEAVTQATLLPILAMIPSSWPLADADLEGLGYFLEARAPLVAARLRSL